MDSFLEDESANHVLALRARRATEGESGEKTEAPATPDSASFQGSGGKYLYCNVLAMIIALWHGLLSWTIGKLSITVRK